MKIHRITLNNFRGIESRTVEFQTPGITVVVGPNEIGKSSLAEALRLIRAYKDSSKHREITAIKPTHRDLAPEVEIDCETGPYRFSYRKRWLKKPQTELTIHLPKPAQLTGDEAHERVEQIFAETVDPELWTALQQVQGESLLQPALAKVSPLLAALSERTDVIVDDAYQNDLMARIEAEYHRYFTKTGAMKREYASVGHEFEQARAAADQAREELLAVSHAIERHERLIEQRASLKDRVSKVTTELSELHEQHRLVAGLIRRQQDSVRKLEQRQFAAEVALGALTKRTEQVSEVMRLRQRSDELADKAQRSRQEFMAAQEVLSLFDRRQSSSTATLAEARTAVDAISEQLAGAQAAEELELAKNRLQQVDDATARLQAAELVIAANSIDEQVLRELSEAHIELQAAQAAAPVGAAQIRIEPLADAEIQLDGQPIHDHAVVDVTREVLIEAPDLLRVIVVPDGAAVSRAEHLANLADELAKKFAEYEVRDIIEARQRAAIRRDAIAERDDARAARDIALGGQPREELEARISILSERSAAGEVLVLEEKLADARKALDQLETVALDENDRREELTARLQAASDSHIKASAVHEAAQDEAERAASKLAADRESASDEELADAHQNSLRVQHEAAEELTRADRQLADHGAEALQTLIENAEPAQKRAIDDLRACERDITAVETELEIRGRDGLQDRLDDALATVAHVERREHAIAARAQAAQLLYLTMTRHQATAQQRYVAPFKSAIERLAAVVFGSGFEVEISDDLSIVSRTWQGVTVSFESLSGGAREQLSLIGRLATAQLVSADAGAPVIIDDALGFTDSARRAKLAAVLNKVGQTAQIIILTCEPERFAGIGQATTVSLN